MLGEMPNIEAAKAIISMDPLPIDAEARLDALYVKASELEKSLFADIYEGLFTLQNV